MTRKSNNRSYFSSRSPVSIPKSVPVSKPAVTHSASQVTHSHNVNVERPGFFSNMWQGFGLGAGQAIAHNWFRSDPVVKHVHENTPSPSSKEIMMPKEYTQCMKDNNNDKDLCKQFLDEK
jgi:hypothetical protein